ncbi:MAG: hypothetical protein KatS3mg057_0164 [Herpetosiphonaceae bacterium]|nr:MAG: hypothetical protein KatS3mg057_0164 [Herpetosiphonaceae bacterium]
MAGFDDRDYLRNEQYHDSSNLNARIQLHVRFGTNPYGWQRWVFDQFDLGPQVRILELGCGSAWLWAENLDRIPAGWKVTLTDFSPGMVQQARSTVQEKAEHFSFAVVDAQALAFADACIDAVIANHMLYHVPDRQRAFSEIRRVLRPGGRFYAATNGRAHLQELSELASRFGYDTPLARELSFNLEHGAAELEPWFASVTLRRYEDGLAITETAPLIDYLLSLSAKGTLSNDRLEQLKSYVERELAQHGAVRVTKDTGLFIATKAD